MVHGLWHGAGAVVVGAAAGLVVALWVASSPPAAQARPHGPKAATTTVVESVPYDLYTHCGVGEARVGNRYFVAVHPLSDGSGNPPAGWGNPFQAGTMTLVSPAEAVFTDSAGHRVVFRVRPGAKTFLRTCS